MNTDLEALLSLIGLILVSWKLGFVVQDNHISDRRFLLSWPLIGLVGFKFANLILEYFSKATNDPVSVALEVGFACWIVYAEVVLYYKPSVRQPFEGRSS